jgi:peroxiredoxin
MRFSNRAHENIAFYTLVPAPYRRAMTKITCSFALLFAASALGQIEAGQALPSLSLALTDGTTLQVAVEGGKVAVLRGGKPEAPRAVMVHFLQPDCLQCQAQLKPMQAVHAAVAQKGGLVVGAAHRGDLEAVRAMQAKLGVTFPMGVLQSKAGLEKAVGGDACVIADQTGVVRFAQAGFGEGDEKLWSEVFEALLAGRPSPHATVARGRLKVGEPFPAVRLPSLRTGRPMEYASVDGRIRFTDEDGKQTSPKGAIFFFSRY